MRFNEFYKQNVQKTGKKKNTKTNSPLFVVVFKCIVSSFKHFHKYIDVLENIPHRITQSATKVEIDNLWLQFLLLPENKELLELYDNDLEETTNDDEEKIKTDYKEEPEGIKYFDDLDNIL